MYNESAHYHFCLYVDAVISNGNAINEISIPSFLSKQIGFVKDLAQKTSTSVKDLLKVFTNKTVFSFFSKIGWSIAKLYNIIKQGFGAYRTILNAIGEYLSKTKVGKWTEDALKDLDEWLQKHPKVKKIGGVVVAGLLVYIWLNMTFTGDFEYDFNLTDAISALSGKYTLATIFAGTEGAKLLMLFATGALAGLSFPWPSPQSVQLLVAIVTSLAKWAKTKLTKESTHMNSKDIRRIIQEELMLLELGDGSAGTYDYNLRTTKLPVGRHSIESFASDSGLMYMVKIDRIDDDTLLVGFMATDGIREILDGVTNKNEVFKVMATITSMLKTYMKHNDVDTIAYNPVFNKSDSGRGRDKLYKLFINFAAKAMNKRVQYSERPETYYYGGKPVFDRYVFAKLV